MSTIKSEDENVAVGIPASNRQLLQALCVQDGGLVSPIDLTLAAAKPLKLEPLRWVNFDVPPFRMKLTNSGDTLVISAKWAKERPYLTGGPLNGNYVFSQIHFHWGSSEDEGSEHTVKGVCYPMEMHVVFFKTRYLTQAAALKQDDGIAILAYLFRLQTRSAPGHHWLASQLRTVVEPRTSAQVPTMPLATLMVPFVSDYVTYWGALMSQNCRHPVLWLVSRAALSISLDDLNLFRSLLNSRKENMTKNFRPTSPSLGRAIFHVNPSTDTNNLLLPGAVDPPCQAVIVNHSQMPAVHQTDAKKIFEKGDSNELEAKDSLRGKIKKESFPRSKPHVRHEGQPVSNQTNLDTSSTLKLPSQEKSMKRSMKNGTKLQRQCTVTKRGLGKENVRNPTTGLLDRIENNHKNPVFNNVAESCKLMKKEKTLAGTRNGEGAIQEKEDKTDGKQPNKSRLPVPKTNTRKYKPELESRYASYFKRPESAPNDQSKPKTPHPRPSTRTGGN